MDRTEFASPSGKYHFQIFMTEMRMSHWVERPRLVRVEGEVPLFDLSNSQWSLEGANWQGEEKVELQLRRYPGDHSPPVFRVEVDCLAATATWPDDTVVPLAKLESSLEQLYTRSRLK
ncbi:hypothetical protein EON80_14160 [bacterium]|nr:MAG: hypothetical protein EON80_14160 [bacterium]